MRQTAIETRLGQLDAATRAHARKARGLHTLAAGLASVGIGIIAAQLDAPRFGWALILTTLLGGSATWLWDWLKTRTRQGQLMGAARLAEQLVPALGSAPSSALDLTTPSARAIPFSRSLIALHVDLTAQQLLATDLEQRVRQLHRPRFQRARFFLVGAGLWAGVWLLALNQGRSRLAAVLLDPSATQQSSGPLAGDIRLTYHFPAYTGLPDRTVAGGDGTIMAVVGTQVQIEARADLEVRRAEIWIESPDDPSTQKRPLTVDSKRRLHGQLSVLEEGQYRFALVDIDGDQWAEQRPRAIHAQVDAYPEIYLDQPDADRELKDDQNIDVLWRARDDFGVGEVFLVAQPLPTGAPQRVALAHTDETDQRREGRYLWSVHEQGLAPGSTIEIYLEAWDNDQIGGPKKSVSAKRTLSLFSARRHHEALLDQQRVVLDAMVDWLAGDLTAPANPTPDTAGLATQRAILSQMGKVETLLTDLLGALRQDQLTKPEFITALENLREHTHDAHRARQRAVAIMARVPTPAGATARLRRLQRKQIAQTETDIIYLDDLLALQKIDELKATAHELLAAQHHLQELLDQYRQTQDPALRAALEQQIRQLRKQMMALLARMASIKQTLPGEYRNLEAATMVTLDDQLDRLEEMLQQGDLDGAARELEQLANMMENMVNAIDQAEQEYGGERYAALRQQLGEFAAAFRRLESEQKALADRAAELVQEYRRAALDGAGQDLDGFVRKVRQKTRRALRHLDNVAAGPELFHPTEEDLDGARQRLLDLDALLETRDFAEATAMGHLAEEHAEALEGMLDHQRQWAQGPPGRKISAAHQASAKALRQVREINNLLDRLFPKPSDVLPPSKLAQLDRMGKKQQQLEQQAQKLGQQMAELAQEVPLFGGQPRANLDAAESEMGQAVERLAEGELPGAARHEQRAVDELSQLREALEQAAQGNGSGLPLPLSMGGGGRSGPGQSGPFQNRDVEIPRRDQNRAKPQFRRDLMEAAKQKAPQRYEEAVRRYYEELIR